MTDLASTLVEEIRRLQEKNEYLTAALQDAADHLGGAYAVTESPLLLAAWERVRAPLRTTKQPDGMQWPLANGGRRVDNKFFDRDGNAIDPKAGREF